MKNKILLPILMTLLAAACVPQPATQSSSNNDSGEVIIGGGGNDGGGNNGGGGSSSGQGSTCHGSEQDGQGPGVPIYHFNLLLSGGVSWVPNEYANSFAYESNINLEEGHLFFSSDSRLRVRFKVMPQPSPPVGEKYCYNRETGKASDPFDYTKLKFTLYLRDILCDSVDPNDSSKCNQFSLGNRYRARTVGPINVDSCSPIIDIGNLRNSTQWGTVVEVAYVNADSACQAGEAGACPAEKAVRPASCWNMTMQVVTDYTQDFK